MKLVVETRKDMRLMLQSKKRTEKNLAELIAELGRTTNGKHGAEKPWTTIPCTNPKPSSRWTALCRRSSRKWESASARSTNVWTVSIRPWSTTESNSRPEHGPSPASTNGWEKLTPTTRVYSRN